MRILGQSFRDKCGQQYVYYVVCECHCGKKTIVRKQQVKSGRVKSCGCLHKQKISSHGMSNTKVYKTWQSMKQRCFNPKNIQYYDYGGRGITVCERWMDFQNFFEDMGHTPRGCSLDRIDNNLGYDPKNCKWSTRQDQERNKRNNRLITFENETKTLAEWLDRQQLHVQTFYSRTYRGLSDIEALGL
jgi:hypothetical protein